MARTKFVIQAKDFLHASEYLINQLRLRKLELEESVLYSDAEQGLMSILGSGHRANQRATLLQDWCQENLSDKDWTNLKTNVRKRRQRWKNFEATKTITVSAEVHSLLARLANRDNVTFNDVLRFSLNHTARSEKKIRPSR